MAGVWGYILSFFIFGHTSWHVGSSFPRPGIKPMPLCSEIVESLPLDHQGSPHIASSIAILSAVPVILVLEHSILPSSLRHLPIFPFMVLR